MTVRQAVEYIEASQKRKEDTFRDQAILLHVQVLQLSSAIGKTFDKKVKYLELGKAYPELFGTKKNKTDYSNYTQEQLQEMSTTVWRTFLGK